MTLDPFQQEVYIKLDNYTRLIMLSLIHSNYGHKVGITVPSGRRF